MRPADNDSPSGHTKTWWEVLSTWQMLDNLVSTQVRRNGRYKGIFYAPRLRHWQLEGQHLGTHHLFNIGLTFLQALMSLDQNLDNVDNYPELCQTSIEKDKQSMKITRWVERSLAVYRAVHQQRFLSSHTGWTVAKHGTLSPPSMALFWSFSAPQNHFLDVSSILILSFRLVISMPQAWSIIRCVLLGQNQNRDQITLLYCNSAYHNIPQILYKVFSCLQINVMVLHDTPQYSHIFVLRSRMFLEIFFAPL